MCAHDLTVNATHPGARQARNIVAKLDRTIVVADGWQVMPADHRAGGSSTDNLIEAQIPAQQLPRHGLGTTCWWSPHSAGVSISWRPNDQRFARVGMNGERSAV
jgi:hypothetical protein